MTVVAADRASTRARKTVYSDELSVGQRNDLHISEDNQTDNESGIQTVDTPLGNDHLSQLAFNEEPVKIIIHAIGENPENAVFVQVNGRGAEVLMNDKFVSMGGYLPCDIPVTTKRKYLEVLARAKKETINTDFGQNASSGEAFNTIKRRNALQHNFEVLEDKNPIGRAWLQSIISDKI